MKLLRLGVVLVCLGCLPGCVQEQRYVVERDTQRMTESTPAFFVDEDDNAFFRVQRRYAFPITPPPDGTDLRAGGDPAPFPRFPWVHEADIGYQLDWSLQNESDTDVEAILYLDGVNEFHLYEPTPPDDFHQYERRLTLEAGERKTGTVRDVELSEIAIDLATVVNGAPNSNQVVFVGSDSRTDERIQPYIPDVIPGLVGLRVGMLTTAALPLALRVSIRATDWGERLARRADPEWDLPDPASFVPVVPED